MIDDGGHLINPWDGGKRMDGTQKVLSTTPVDYVLGVPVGYGGVPVTGTRVRAKECLHLPPVTWVDC
jgi:hypothetical protein